MDKPADPSVSPPQTDAQTVPTPADATPQAAAPEATTTQPGTETPASDPQPAEATQPADPAEAPTADATTPPQDPNTPPTDTATTPPADGSTAPAAPASAPAAESAKTPEQGKTSLIGKLKGLLKKKTVLIAIPVVLVLLAGIFLFLSHRSKSVAKADTPSDQSSSSSSAQADASPTLPDCISGYKPYANKVFSICYPITMSLKSPDATSSAKQFVFEDDVETLTVDTDYKDNLNKFNCVSDKVVTVSGFSAQRYLIKDSSKSNCLQTINSYALLVSIGNGKPVFNIGLSKKSGSYLSDNGEFDIITQSFQINQQ